MQSTLGRRNITARFFQTAGLITGLFLIETGLLFGWARNPESRLLPAAAAVIGVWLATAGLLAAWRIYRQLIEPVGELEDFAGQLVRGDFPPPLKSAAGRREAYPELNRSLGILRDRLQNLNARLRDSQNREQLQRRGGDSAELRNRILADLAPELRRPLGSLGGYLRLLALRSDAPQRGEWLQACETQLAAAEKQLERLIDISELVEAEPEENGSAAFDAAAFLRQTIDSNARYLKDRGITLVNRYSADLPEEFTGSRVLLMQLLGILIRSAGLSAEPGETVEFICTRENGSPVFTLRGVEHTGDGAPLAEAFRKYREYGDRLPPENTELAVLGLLFVEAEAAKIRARLAIDTDPEVGTELKLYLDRSWSDMPRRPGTAGAIRFAGNSEKTAAAADQPAAAEYRFPERLLVFSRTPEPADILRALHPQCRLLAGGMPPALPHHCGPGDFDAAVCFIPDKRGDRLAEEFEAFMRVANTAGLPVVAVLNRRSERLTRLLERAGVRRTLSEPVNYPELEKLLSRCRRSAGADA